MKKNKLLTILISTIFIMLISLSLTSATISVISPASSSTNSGTVVVNITLANADCDECLNATLYYNASGGAVDTSNALTTITNSSQDPTEFYSGSVSISSLSDATTYRFSALVANASGTFWSSVNTSSVTIDNTNPSCSSTKQKATVEFLKPIDLTCSCTDAIDSSVTVTRTLTKPTGSTVTPTTSPYTTSGTDLNEKGTYTWDCSGTDDSGNSNSATQLSFRVVSDGVSTIDEDVGISGLNKGVLITFIVLILLIVIGIAVAFNK